MNCNTTHYRANSSSVPGDPTLAWDDGLREAIGAANREKARAQFDEKAMVAAYRDVYGAALGRKSFP